MASPLKSQEYEQAIERAAIEKLDTQLGAFIQEFAGTCLDYDPALEAAIIEAIAHDDASDSEKD